MFRRTTFLTAALFWALSLSAGEAPKTELSFGNPPPPPPPPPGVETTAAPGVNPAAKQAENTKTGAQIIEEVLSGKPAAKPEQTAPSSAVTPKLAPNDAEENQPAFKSDTTQPGTAPVETSKPVNAPAPSAGWMLFRFLGSMVVIVVLMGAGYWWLKKYRSVGLKGRGGQGLLEVVARTYVEPGRSVLLVKAGKRIIIVGSTAQGLSRLGEISDNVEVEALLRQAGQGKPGVAFPAELKLAEKDLSKIDESV